MYFFFNLIEQHSKFWLHTLQVPYICTLCDSTNINTIIEFVSAVRSMQQPSFQGYLREEEKHKPDP